MKTISNITRILFFVGLLAIAFLLLSLVPLIGKRYKSDEDKVMIKNRLYIIGGVAIVVIASALVGSYTYSKL